MPPKVKGMDSKRGEKTKKGGSTEELIVVDLG